MTLKKAAGNFLKHFKQSKQKTRNTAEAAKNV